MTRHDYKMGLITFCITGVGDPGTHCNLPSAQLICEVTADMSIRGAMIEYISPKTPCSALRIDLSAWPYHTHPCVQDYPISSNRTTVISVGEDLQMRYSHERLQYQMREGDTMNASRRQRDEETTGHTPYPLLRTHYSTSMVHHR